MMRSRALALPLFGLLGCAHAPPSMVRDEDARIAALEEEVATLRRALPTPDAPVTPTTVLAGDPDGLTPTTAVDLTGTAALTLDEGTDAGEPEVEGEGDRIVLRLHEEGPLPVVSERLPVVDMPAAPPFVATVPVAPAPGTPSAAPLPYEAPAVAPVAPVAPTEDLRLYREGLAHLTARRYEAAVSSIGAFLRDHPGSARADDALYFRATAHYALRRYREALVDYERVLRLAPAGDRAADSLLHAALCHRHLGDDTRAASLLGELRRRFPDSVAARLATREDSI